MTETRKEYMKDYMANRRAVNTDVNTDVNKLPPEEMLTDEMLTDVNTEPVAHQSSLLQNLLKWSWCYTGELPSKEWIAKHKSDCHGVSS